MLDLNALMEEDNPDAYSVAVALFVFMGKTSIAAYNVKVMVFVCAEDKKINAITVRV